MELQAVGVQEQADLRAGEGVVAVGGSVDDGFVGDVEIVGDGIATVRPLIRWRPHEAGDDDDAGVDLVGDGAGEPFRVDEIVGGQSGSPVARGFDGARGGGIRSVRSRRPGGRSR